MLSTAVMPVANVFDDPRIIQTMAALQADHVALPVTTFGALKVAVMGDSISANGGILPGGLRTQATQGYTTWLQALSMGAVNIEPFQNCSLSGQTTPQFISNGYLATALAQSPHITIVEGGTNDSPNGVTLAQSQAALTQIYTSLLNIGSLVVAIMVTPRQTPNNVTSAQDLQARALNRWIRRFAATQGRMFVYDPRTTNFVNATGDGLRAGYNSDGLHPNAQGAYVYANGLWTLLKTIVPNTSDLGHRWIDPVDLHDATNNLTGNLVTNGLMTTTTGGTIGTNNQSKLTGTIPSGFSCNWTDVASAYPAGTLVASVVARSDGLPGNLAQIVATALTTTGGTGASGKLQFFQQFNFPTDAVVGDTYEGICLVNVNATTGFAGAQLDIGISDGNGGTLFATCMGNYTNSAGNPQGTYSLVLKTPRIQVQAQAGATQRVMNVAVELYNDGTVTGAWTAQVSEICVRKVNF